MNKPQKRFFLIMTILEALAIAGCFVFNYFTVNKLGMVRWVNFNSMKWEKALPMPAVKLAVIAGLVLFTALLLVLYARRRAKLRTLALFMVIGTVVLSLGCIGFVLFASFSRLRAYYFLCMLLFAAAILQLIKAYTGVFSLVKAAPPVVE